MLPNVTINITDKSRLGREGFIWLTHPDHSQLREAKVGAQRQELKQRPWRNAASWLAHMAFSVWFFFFHITQDHLSRGGIAHSGLGPLT